MVGQEPEHSGFGWKVYHAGLGRAARQTDTSEREKEKEKEKFKKQTNNSR